MPRDRAREFKPLLWPPLAAAIIGLEIVKGLASILEFPPPPALFLMQPVALALFWHQHQPYYPDDVGGENVLPWVRLHGSRDYYGMALHLKEVPEFRCTINLVPSLLVQILRYTEGGGSDRHLDMSRRAADTLSAEEAEYLLDYFFMANADNMIRPHPRYQELYLKRGLGLDPARRAVPRFTVRDLRDLQVWNNLVWMHELEFERDPDLRAFRAKGQGWTESEKEWLLDRQMEVLRKIIPLHRELAEAGQVELTTTPFFHPILPLLWDKRCAREAMPSSPLPRHLEPYREDARAHVARAVAFHREVFGRAAVGMWPAEGSVSQEVIAPIAEAGIEWIATDEEILSRSTDGWVSRDGQGHLRNPGMLYRPWRVEQGDKSLQILFRDHALSDLIGFHYQRSDPEHAAHDLVGRLLAIGRAVEFTTAGRPALVPIILDGENCWEYYPDGGVRFLRTLYRTCAGHASIRPLRVRDALQEHPAVDRLGRLFAGSWISHNFSIWIGHQEDNTAWDLLHQTRAFLRQAESEGHAAPELLSRAWDEVFIAEGSDWYWWFGDDHSSAHDALFDQLFRKHLKNVYLLLDAPVPNELNHPIARIEQREVHTRPTGFLRVRVDGRSSYFEWISAGRYVAGSERGAMAKVTDALLREVRFGFDAERLMIRVDTAGRARDDLAQAEALAVRFIQPEETEIRLTGLKDPAPAAQLRRGGQAVDGARIEAAVDHIVELAVPFEDLGVKPEDTIQMAVEALSGTRSLDRAPHEGVLEVTVPAPEFELEMWQV